MQVEDGTARLTLPELVGMLVLAVLLLTLPQLRGSALSFRHASGMRLLVGALELAFVVSVTLDRRVRWPRFRDLSPPVKWLAGSWALWTTLTVALASHPAPAVVRQAEWWITILFGVSLWSFLQAHPPRIGWVYFAVPAGIVLYGWYLLGFAFDPRAVAAFRWSYFEAFQHVRHFGYYTAIAVPFAAAPLVAVAASVDGVSRVTIVFSVVATFVALVLMFGAGGRGPVYALALSLVTLRLLDVIRVSWKLMVGGLLLTVASGLAAYAVESIHPTLGIMSILGRSVEAASFNQMSSGRGELWRLSFDAFRTTPLFGAGPDGYMFVARPGFERAIQPHNAILMFLLEWGLPGCTLALALIAALMRRARAALRSGSIDGRDTYRLGAFWCLLVVLTLSLVDGPLYHAHSLMLTTVAVILSLLTPPQRLQWGFVPRVRPRVAIGVFATVLASILALHAGVKHIVQTDQPPPAGSVRARLLKSFPCEDTPRDGGPFRWSHDALASDPSAALEWARFGARHTRRPYHFAYLEALIRIKQEDYGEARHSLASAIEGCLPTTHPRFKARSVEARLECDSLRALDRLVEAGVLDGSSLELDQAGFVSAVRVTDDDAAAALRQALPGITVTR